MKNFLLLIDKLLPIIGVVVGIAATKISDLLLDSKKNTKKNVELRRDDDLERIEKTTYEIMDMSNDYWSKDADSEENKRLGNSVNAKVSFLALLIRELFENHEDEWRQVTIVYWDFHESCTGDEYFGLNREPILDRIREIELNAYKLVYMARNMRRRLPYGKT